MYPVKADIHFELYPSVKSIVVSFLFVLGGTQLKTLDVKTVEVKVEPTSTKSGDSLNTSAASTSSSDGKGRFSLLKYMHHQKYAHACLDLDFDVSIYFSDKDDDGDPLNILGEKDVTPVGEQLQVFMYSVFKELHDVLVG